ncbi:hypothetical protein V8017_21730 [Stenotrophomonas rhizophila]
MSRGCTGDDVIVAGRAVRRSSYSAANQVPSKDQRQENFQGVPCGTALMRFFYFKYERQESFLLHENVYLIEAEDDEQALLDAKKLAMESEDLSEDGHLEVDGNKASYRFAGIRKLIEVQLDSDKTNRKLDSGVELTYSVLVVDSLAEVEQLARGEMTHVLYQE